MALMHAKLRSHIINTTDDLRQNRRSYASQWVLSKVAAMRRLHLRALDIRSNGWSYRHDDTRCIALREVQNLLA